MHAQCILYPSLVRIGSVAFQLLALFLLSFDRALVTIYSRDKQSHQVFNGPISTSLSSLNFGSVKTCPSSTHRKKLLRLSIRPSCKLSGTPVKTSKNSKFGPQMP